jgi:hypothetical protein
MGKVSRQNRRGELDRLGSRHAGTSGNFNTLDSCPTGPCLFRQGVTDWPAFGQNASPEGLVEPVEYAKITESGPVRLAMKVDSIAFREVHELLGRSQEVVGVIVPANRLHRRDR